MSPAKDELVARAQDPNASLETLHQLAQNYPGLRPHIAANPRTYPALLKWLGTLGDPEVDAALASRGEAVDASGATTQMPSSSPAAGSVSSTAPMSAASTAPMRAAGSASSAGSAMSAVSAGSAMSAGSAGTAPIGSAGSAVSAGSAASAGSAGVAGGSGAWSPQGAGEPQPGHTVGQSFSGPVSSRPATVSRQSTSRFISSPASPYTPGQPTSPTLRSPERHNAETHATPIGAHGQPSPAQPVYAVTQPTGEQTVYHQQPAPASLPGSIAPGMAAPAGAAAGAAAGQATVFGVGTDIGQEEEETTASPSGRFLWILAVAVLALIVFITAWFLASGNDEDPSAAPEQSQSVQEEPSTIASAQDQGAKTASPTPTPTSSATIKAPAPEDAIELSSFTSPSGNITCTMTEDSVSCTIKSYDFDFKDGGSSCSAGSKPFTVSVGNEGQASGACGDSFDTTGASLQYGASAKNAKFACTSAESGIQCWSQVSGQGFTLSRSGSETTAR